MLTFGVLATIAAKAVDIEGAPGWIEPVNLYIVVAMLSGERKSAVYRDAFAPIEILERMLIDRIAPLIAERLQDRRIAEKVLAVAEKTAAGDPSHRTEAQSALRLLEQIDVPVAPRLLADDITPEALATLVAEQGGRMTVAADEGKLFDIAAGLYSAKGSQPNHDVLLKGHAGGTLRVDRKGRDPEFVSNIAITLALAIQPHKIDELVRIPGAVEDGLVGRMLFALPTSSIGWRKQNPDPMPAEVCADYHELVRRVARRCDQLREEGDMLHLTLHPDAYARSLVWREERETWLRPGGKLRAIGSWGSKLPGATMRIAALLHLAKRDPGDVVSLDTFEAALIISDYLVAHALGVSDRTDADEVAAAARKAVDDFLPGHPDGFSTRDFYNNRFAKKVDAEPVLLLLQRHGYIHQLPVEKPGPSGGRTKSERWVVNPRLLPER